MMAIRRHLTTLWKKYAKRTTDYERETYQWDAGINKEVHDVREAWLRKNFHGFMGEVLDEAEKTYTQVTSRASNGKNYGLLAPFGPNWMRLQEKATGAPVCFQALFEDTPSQKGVYTTLKTKRVAVYFFIVFAFCVLKESFIFKQLSASGTVITQLDLPKKNENLVRCSKCREVCIVMYDAMGKKWKSRSKGSFVLSCMGLWTKNADKEAGQATPPSTIQMISENKTASKLQSKRKNAYVSRDTMQKQARMKSQESLNY
ncbi:hypothetical protein Tco_0906186 [Tanacetum coccineum]